MGTDVERNIAGRPKLSDFKNFNRNEGVVKKLYSILYGNGPGNGTFLSLPFDQLVEHGPEYIETWKREIDTEDIYVRGEGCADPRAVVDLVNSGHFSAYVLHPGIADYASNFVNPSLPLIYKIDGRSTQPAEATIQSIIGSIDHAKTLGASAIGTSLYPGSEDIRLDMERVSSTIQEAHKEGFPVVVWAYARGPEVDEVKESLYWTSKAVGLAFSLGADIIKTKYPKPVSGSAQDQYCVFLEKKKAVRFRELEPENGTGTDDLHVKRVSLLTKSAPGSFVVVSGGPKLEGDAKEQLIRQTEIVMDGGAEGRIIGRNFWGVPVHEALEYADAVQNVMRKSEYIRVFSRGAFK